MWQTSLDFHYHTKNWCYHHVHSEWYWPLVYSFSFKNNVWRYVFLSLLQSATIKNGLYLLNLTLLLLALHSSSAINCSFWTNVCSFVATKYSVYTYFWLILATSTGFSKILSCKPTISPLCHIGLRFTVYSCNKKGDVQIILDIFELYMAFFVATFHLVQATVCVCEPSYVNSQ